MPKLLTKTKYVTGLQCLYSLWMEVNRQDLLPEPDESIKVRFEQGHVIGELATKLYPEGINVQGKDFADGLQKTNDMLAKGKPLFEAGFLAGRLYGRADILVPSEKMWDIVEVKSGTSVKEEHIHDVTFQKYVYKKAGIRIGKCYVMHINKEYVKHGEIDPSELFTKTEITEEVEKFIGEIEDRTDTMLSVIDHKEPPEHCESPKTCKYPELCWKFLPAHNVFQFVNGSAKAIELFEKGIVELKDVPEDYKLTTRQRIQRDSAKGTTHVDKQAIEKFLSEIKKPLHFLDFETMNTAIPVYDGTRPYQQIPFQFSLHIIDGEPIHRWFLAESKEDPRRAFLKALKEMIGERGSILVYNASFEKRILTELGSELPEYASWIESVLARVIDLLIPFRSFWYYTPCQHGRVGMKTILPAVTGKGYEDMEIADGETAAREFLRVMQAEVSENERQRVRESLVKYCGRDTEGMIHIWEELKKLVSS